MRLVQGLDLALRADTRLHVRNIARLASAIDHHEEAVTLFRRTQAQKHQVVDDAALIGEQQAVALLAHGQAQHVHRHQALQSQART